jgi:FkbM family methyltransferase
MSILETPEVYNYVKDILDKDGPIVFEIGMNDGLDTQEILKYCRGDFQYYGFEPDPDLGEHLRGLRGKLKGAILTEQAISNFQGTADFYHFSDKKNPNDFGAMGPSSLLEPLPYEHWLPHLKHEVYKVYVTTLDVFCDKNGIDHIDFLWADMQGSEYGMIEGGQKILKNTGWMFIEAMKNAQYKNQKLRGELVEKLGSFDWEIVREWEVDLLLRNKSIVV